jgi:zinc protease
VTTMEVPPSVEAPANWRFPAYRDDRLANGLRVLVYQCPGQYVAAATLLFDVPLNAESRDVEGVAELTARCLPRGTVNFTAEEFADQLAMCGAELDASASIDACAMHLTVPVGHLARGLELMAEAVRQATFAESEVAHERALRLQEIDQSHAYPQSVANEQLNAALFGDARAARPTGGGTETVSAVSPDDVKAFAEGYLVPATATLLLAGDFASVDPVAAAARGFADWTREGDPIPHVEDPEIVPGPQLLLVDWPEAPQSTIRVAGRAVTRGDLRWPAMFVANHAVGGSFSARINTVLREEKGYTYGATSTLDSTRRTGIFSVSTAVDGAATAEAVSDILSIVAAAQGTITDAEVATAVRAVTQSAPLGYERAEAVAGRAELLISQRLPLDHVDTNLERIRAVTTATANAAYNDIVDPDTLTVLVVGDASSARPGLGELGYATLRDLTLPWR